MSRASSTTDHDRIRRWTEERKGRPTKVEKGGDAGILRIDFGAEDEGLQEIRWEGFFQFFDGSDPAFLHQDKTADGYQSRFNTFVAREGDRR